MENNKFMGVSKVGEKGQIVIPKAVRDMFNINPGDTVIIFSHRKKGIALIKADAFDDVTDLVLEGDK